jgi:hypothetical protein
MTVGVPFNRREVNREQFMTIRPNPSALCGCAVTPGVAITVSKLGDGGHEEPTKGDQGYRAARPGSASSRCGS